MKVISLRKGNIDLLKFIFACVLVVYHFNAYVGTGLFQAGYNVVSFFFILSGFFMMESVENKPMTEPLGTDTFEFIKKKISRIAPEFYVSWVIAFIVCHMANFNVKTCLKDLSESLFDLFFIKMTGLKAYSPNNVTWYISAMLLAMAIIWPIARRWTDMYIKVISPMALVIMLGIFCQRYESISSWKDWMGIIYSGLFRAIFSIMAGSICWSVSHYIKAKQVDSTLATFVSIMSFVSLIYLLCWGEGGIIDFGIFVLFMVLVTVASSGVSKVSKKLNCKFCYWLGEVSVVLYLGHNFWKKFLIDDIGYYSSEGYVSTFVSYVVLTFITVLLILFLSKTIRRFFKNN